LVTFFLAKQKKVTSCRATPTVLTLIDGYRCAPPSYACCRATTGGFALINQTTFTGTPHPPTPLRRPISCTEQPFESTATVTACPPLELIDRSMRGRRRRGSWRCGSPWTPGRPRRRPRSVHRAVLLDRPDRGLARSPCLSCRSGRSAQQRVGELVHARAGGRPAGRRLRRAPDDRADVVDEAPVEIHRSGSPWPASRDALVRGVASGQ